MSVYRLPRDFNISLPICIAAFAGATIALADILETTFSRPYYTFSFNNKNWTGVLMFVCSDLLTVSPSQPASLAKRAQTAAPFKTQLSRASLVSPDSGE